MLRIADRYILREVIPPFVLGLLVLTFVLMLPPLMNQAEELIAKGVDGVTIARLMLALVPQGFGLALPMALLIGILMGLGRMSTDREMVALQACGVSVYRMLRPVALLAIVATGLTFYVIEVAVPYANRQFLTTMAQVTASRAEGEVQPRVFYDGYDGLTLYVREVSPAGWSDVFLADTRDAERFDVSVAERGRVEVDAERQAIDLVLYDGTRHRSDTQDPTRYEMHEFGVIRLSIDLPRTAPQPGLNELTLPDLRREVERMQAAGESPHRPIMEIHERFSVPVACLVFALVGVGLGITTRKDARSSSFGLGIAVIFVYYVGMYLPEAMAKGALVSPHLAKWLPNILLGLVGLILVAWRSHLSERRIPLPGFRAGGAPDASAPTPPADAPEPPPERVVRMSGRGLPGVSLLDGYVTFTYLRWVSMAVVGLLGIFYISTFIDLADKLFKGQTSLLQLLEYFWFATPQFLYYVLPISALVATLVTIGALTRSSELTVMKACGISLARVALPMFALSLVWSACLFALDEGVLGMANRRAEAIRHEIRSGVPPPPSVLDRGWIAGAGNTLYHARHIDHEQSAISGLSVYELEDGPWRLRRRTFAGQATFADGWEGRDVWTRGFPAPEADNGAPVYEAPVYEAAAAQPLAVADSPETFRTEQPDPDVMGLRQLESYVETLRARGLDVVNLVVAMHRKASFPFVSFVLTLIAVPFAVTTGSRGALYGVGAGIVLAFSYWVILSVFGAIGSAGLLTPALAAWSPNVLFGGTAAYFLLTTRT